MGVPPRAAKAEWTRTFVVPDKRSPGLRGTPTELCCAVMEYALGESLSAVGGVQETYFMPHHGALKWRVEPMGMARQENGEWYIVAYIEVSEAALADVRRDSAASTVRYSFGGALSCRSLIRLEVLCRLSRNVRIISMRVPSLRVSVKSVLAAVVLVGINWSQTIGVAAETAASTELAGKWEVTEAFTTTPLLLQAMTAPRCHSFLLRLLSHSLSAPTIC